MNAKELLDRAVSTLKASDSLDHWQADRDQIEAEELLTWVMDHEEPSPLDEIPPAAARRFERFVARRATGEPVPYILGESEFLGLWLDAKPGVFVPRDSTEFLAEQAIRRLRLRGDPVAVDLACGSGAVALAIANDVSGADVTGTDLAPDAIKLGRRNARKLGLEVQFVVGDLFAGLPARLHGIVDVITVHPPYVAEDELDHLPDEIKNFEPVHTLTDHSDDGLGFVERMADEAWNWLCKSGWVCVEIAPDRARSVASILRSEGFQDVKSTKGGMGVTRVVVGRAAT
ncbi:MAG: HemK/PrmC family methyltransferase [Actinomycetota bacterium]